MTKKVLLLIFLLCLLPLHRALASAPPVLFVADRDYPPINYLENDLPRGLCVDIVSAMGRVSGRKMTVQLMDWGKAQEMVQFGSADALGLLAVSDERRLLYEFTNPVLTFEYSIFIRSDQTGIASPDDLTGKAVGVTAGGFPRQLLGNRPDLNLVTVARYEDGLQYLLSGAIKAFVADKWVTLYYLQKHEIKFVKVLEKPLAVRDAAFAVRKGNFQLQDELNRYIALLQSEGLIKSIQGRWSGQQVVVMTKERVNRVIEFVSLGVGLLLLMLLLFWIHTLKRQVKERKHAEEKLRISEESYRILLDRAPDGIVVIDSDRGQITDVNYSATQLFGCGREELVGYSLQRFYAEHQPDGMSVPESMRRYSAMVLAGEEMLLERVIHNAAGKQLICEVHLTGLPSQGRRLIRASYRDVTARKIAEKAQVASEKKFRDIFESAPIGIFQTSQEGMVINVNPTMARLFGFDSPEQFQREASDIGRLYCAGQEQRKAIVHDAVASGTFVQREVEYRRRDGTCFSATLYMRFVAEGGSGVGYLEGFIEDITERQRATSQLRKLSQAVEQSPVSILITDAMGKVEFVNPRFTQLTGYLPVEVLGENAGELISASNSPELYHDLWKTITSGGVWEGELRNKRKSGELFWEHVTVSPIRSQTGEITNYLAIHEDVTEQRRMKELLLQSQKMEAVGQLAGGVAHDFNNILTVIAGYAAMVRLAPELSPPLQDKVDQIIAASEKAAQVTRGLLAFSRKQVMDIRAVNLNDIVQQLQKFLVRIIGEDIQLKLVINAPELPVKIDVGQIEQVLMNLGTNARDAMPKGGLLVIETDMQTVETDDQGAVPPKGRYAVISVSDSGTGMDEVTRSRLFEPFFTTKEVGKGTGLGMAIVHGIVTQHNGFIYVYTEPGQGTTFKVYLPLLDQEGYPYQEQISFEPLVGGDETILVAEDDHSLRTLLQEVLTGSGYRVLLANDGEEAVSVFRENVDSIDLVVMDMIMPKRSGWEASQEIYRLKPQALILFTSGYTKDFIRNRGELQEGADLIMKPVQPRELLRAVRRILDGRSDKV